VPNGTIVKDGRDILHESYLGKGDSFGYYPFSDIFRFNLLYKKGGYWVDLDLYATRNWTEIDNNYEYIFASERTIQKGAYRNRTKDKVATICVLKAPRGSGFYRELTLRVMNPKFKISRRDICMVTLRNLLDKYEMEKYLVPYYYFCPVDWWNAKEMFLDEAMEYPLVILDDLSFTGGFHKRFNALNRFAMNSRKLGISVLVTTQYYFSVLPSIRENSSFFVLYNTSQRNLDMISEEHNFFAKKKEFISMYRENVKSKRDFMVVNYDNDGLDIYLNKDFEPIFKD